MAKLKKRKIIYFYNSISLYKACKNDLNIDYNNVTYSIRYYLKTYPNIYDSNNMDELISFLVNKYIMLNFRKKKKSIISDLITGVKVNIKYVSELLKINYKRIYELKKYNYSINEAILIIYFIGDINTEFKSIAKQKVEQILSASYLEKTNNINELICFYYIKKNNSICEKIFNIYYNRFKNLIYKISRLFFIKLQSVDIEDIMIDIQIKLLEKLNNNQIVANHPNQINCFMYKTSFGIIYRKIYEMKKISKEIHLDDKIYDDLTYLDIIPSN